MAEAGDNMTAKEATNFLSAQLYILKFTNTDPSADVMMNAIGIVLERNKELEAEIERLNVALRVCQERCNIKVGQ